MQAAMSGNVERRFRRFRTGKALLAVALVPWLAWILWLGRNDPWADPMAHHRWFMRLEVAFVIGALVSAAAMTFLLSGKGWRRIASVAMALCLLVFYLATALIAD
jgi:hypothetical protein